MSDDEPVTPATAGDERVTPLTTDDEPAAVKAPSLLRNYLSFIGVPLAIASLVCIVLLFLIELTAGTSNPYLGIFTYMLLPGVLIFALVLIFGGMFLERRRRRRLAPGETPTYPSFDLNDPRRRRALFVFLGLSFIFICMSAFGSYRAYEFSESVTFCGATCHTPMKPEFISQKASPHANVRCVECHVGPGPEGFVAAKFNGMHQLYSVLLNKFSRPIATPVHNMPATEGTCNKCHWPERFYGEQLRVFRNYAYDEKNTVNQTRMLINVGGGSPAGGPVSGIHWHMNVANEVSYIATDDQRQVIPWVRMKDAQGKVVEYLAKSSTLSPSQIASSTLKRMNCIDCHSRPTHDYLSPDEALNQAFGAGKLSPGLPYLKREAALALSRPYQTNDEAVAAIARSLDEFYRTNYAQVYASQGGDVRAAIAEVQRIYQTYFFPEMKTDYRAHPNNIGHYYSQGCFRCHDGQHFSNTGQVIRSECNVCHSTLDQAAGLTAPVPAPNGVFRHPVDLGNLGVMNCSVCHQVNAKAAFQHPVALGDISGFKCADCHSGKVYSKPAAFR